MKELIVTADDFGLSPAVNRAVIKAWQEGVLTGASLLVTGPAAAEAVAMAKENPGLQVGLHLVLCQGVAAAQHPGFPSLTTRTGDFSEDPLHTGLRYFFIKPLRRQLRLEIEAQLARFRGTGLPLSHIDGHLNIHLHPTVFDILGELLPHHGIRSIRLSRERLAPELRLAPRRLLGKTLDTLIFTRLADRCRPVLDRLGIGYADEVKGLLNSGRITEGYLLGLLDALPAGLTELYCHPADGPCPELARWSPDYRHREELAGLVSPRVRLRLRELGIRLRNYRGEGKHG